MAMLIADWMKNVLINRYKNGKQSSCAVLKCIEFYYGEGGHALAGEEQALAVSNYTISVRLALRKLLGEDWVAKT